jgi:hypothetical protein
MYCVFPNVQVYQIRRVARIDNVLHRNGVRFIEWCEKAQLLQAGRGGGLLIAFGNMQKY